MFEQFGPLYYQPEGNITAPNNSKYLRLFRRLSDGLYYVKKSDNTIELFSAGILPGPTSLFQKVGSVNNLGAGEDTLYSNDIAAGTFAFIGGNIAAKYTVQLADTLNAKIVRFYFAGTKIFESVVDYSTGTLFNLDFNVFIMRTAAGEARCIVSYVTNGRTESQETTIAGVNFAAINTLLLTGEGVADSDIIAMFAKGIYYPQV